MTTPVTVQLVAVVGGSGAGKGWLVHRLTELLGDRVCHLQLDDFYRDRSHLPMAARIAVNYDEPDAIDWELAERVLHDCRAGRCAQVPVYDFGTYTRTGTRETPAWQPRQILLVDGLWLLHTPQIRALFDLKIYVDTPADIRCTRRLTRDIAERGYSLDLVEHQLRSAVLPMHDRYVEPQKKWADVVLTHPLDPAQISALAARIADLNSVVPESTAALAS